MTDSVILAVEVVAVLIQVEVTTRKQQVLEIALSLGDADLKDLRLVADDVNFRTLVSRELRTADSQDRHLKFLSVIHYRTWLKIFVLRIIIVLSAIIVLSQAFSQSAEKEEQQQTGEADDDSADRITLV